MTFYCRALSALWSQASRSETVLSPPSVLLTAASNGAPEIYALFKRQATNKVYFEELASLYNMYKPNDVATLVKKMIMLLPRPE